MLGDILFSILKYEKRDLGKQQIFSNSTFTFFTHFAIYLENKINAEKYWHFVTFYYSSVFKNQKKRGIANCW